MEPEQPARPIFEKKSRSRLTTVCVGLVAAALYAELLLAPACGGDNTGGVAIDGSAVDAPVLDATTTPGQEASTGDGGSDSAVPSGPAAGWLFVRAYSGGFSAEGALGMAEASATAAVAPQDYQLAANGLAVQSCGAGPFTLPLRPEPAVGGMDFGQQVQLLDGTTVLGTLMKATPATSYSGFGNGAFVGKSVSLGLPEAGAGTITPTTIPGAMVGPSGAIAITAPPMSGSMIAKGQTVTVTWTPFTADTFLITFPGSPPVCRLDPMAGSFTIPAATTLLLTGQGGSAGTMVFSAVNRRIVPVMINGEARSIRGYVDLSTLVNYTIQAQ